MAHRIPTFYVSPLLRHDWFPTPYHFWASCYLLNQIWWRKVTWRANPQGYSQLKHEYLRSVINRRGVLHEVVNALERRGVVCCDGTSVAGSKCYGYKVLEPYVRTRPLACGDPAINHRLHTLGKREDDDMLPVHRWLKDKLNDLYVRWGEARPVLARLKPKRAGGVSAKEHRACREELLNALDGHNSHFKVCEYGRVHTLLTVIENELLPAMRVLEDGEMQPLVSIDLANSQPLLLCQALTHPHPTPPPIPITTGKFTVPCIPVYSRIVDSLRLCEAGKFYESVTREGEDRRRVKRRMLTVLFKRNNPASRFVNRMQERLGQTHPALYRGLCGLKSRDYRHAAHLMQSTESKIFINTVCSRIMREQPRTPVYTKHDSILTTPNHVTYVLGVLKDEFAGLGLSPTFKVKEP